MARLKKTAVDVEDTQAVVQETVDETPSVNEVEMPEKTEKAKEANEIPEYAKEILKIFSNYPELMITARGGVYVPGAKPHNVGVAILYKNPYYKS